MTGEWTGEDVVTILRDANIPLPICTKAPERKLVVTVGARNDLACASIEYHTADLMGRKIDTHTVLLKLCSGGQRLADVCAVNILEKLIKITDLFHANTRIVCSRKVSRRSARVSQWHSRIQWYSINTSTRINLTLFINPVNMRTRPLSRRRSG
jgi:hypothetical protein